MIIIFDDQLHAKLDTADLSESLKNAIRSINVAATVNTTCNKYDLLIDEMGSVYEEVCKVLLGQVSAKELAESIKLKIDYERHGIIPDLVKDLNDQIFLKVRESLIKIAPGTEAPNLDVPAPAKAAPVIGAGEERKSAYGQMGSYVPRKGGPSLVGDIQPTATPQPTQRPTPPPAPRTAPSKPSAPQTPSRSEVLRDIENPTAIKIPPIPRVEASGNVLSIPPAPIKADVLNLKKPATPPPPQDYKADPYREPAE